MGKLASLKKEIMMEPEDWYATAPMESTIFGKIPYGAKRVGQTWVPISSSTDAANRYSYALYVRSVLAYMGIRTDHPRSVARVSRRTNRSQYGIWT